MESINKRIEIYQRYSIDNDYHLSFNDIISANHYLINICLKSLMLRKNMAFNNIMKRINDVFLLEFLCVILQEQNLWTPKLCNGGKYCNIKKAIHLIEMLM